MPVNWDEYREDGFARWDKVPKTYAGRLVTTRDGSFMGKKFPELILDQGRGHRELVIGLSLTQLLRLVTDDPPEEGDWVEITYIGDSTHTIAGQNPTKLFEYKRTPAKNGSDLA